MATNDEKRSAYDLLSIRETAEILRCSETTVRRAVRERRIPWFRVRPRGQIKIPFYGVERLIAPHLIDAVETAKNATAEQVR
jgi:excisionase family DNA binding protein